MKQSRPNVILVTADCLRFDHLSCHRYHRPTTPNIDRLAGQSHCFTRAYAPGPNTPHAFPGIMASVSPLASNKLGLFDARHTLAEMLRANGYNTIGLNAANVYCSRLFDYQRGFDAFHDFIVFEPGAEKARRSSPSLQGGSRITVPEFEIERYVVSQENIDNKVLLENDFSHRILAAVQTSGPAPLFLWVHYMDTHYPYAPREEFQRALGIPPVSKDDQLSLNRCVRENLQLSPRKLNRIIDLYDASVRQLDSKVGRLVSFLKAEALYDCSLIVFTADHGEEFLDHGDLQHKSKLYEELVHVPLFIKEVNQTVGTICNEGVSLRRLAPTVMKSLQIEGPFAGKSMLSFLGPDKIVEEKPIFVEASYATGRIVPVDRMMFNTAVLPKTFSCIHNQWKLIVAEDTEPLLFNLLTDPEEKENLYPSRSECVGGLRQALEERRNKLEKIRITEQVKDVRKKLASLVDGRVDHRLSNPKS